MKFVPNYISLGKIILAMLLLFLKPLSLIFLVTYVLCGVTDLIDGPIARMTNTTSSLGAKLDSAADTILIGIALRRFKTYASIHTYGNKLTGLLLFSTPLWLLHIDHTIWNVFVCIIATISAVEEFIIQITSRELQLDRKGLLIKN